MTSPPYCLFRWCLLTAKSTGVSEKRCMENISQLLPPHPDRFIKSGGEVLNKPWVYPRSNKTNMRTTMTFVMLLATSCCTSQQQSKPQTLHNAEFNWTITIPEGFESVPAEDWEKMQNKGAQAVQNTYGEKVENLSTVIFVFRKGQFNYLEANYQPFDPDIDGDYQASCKGVNEVLYATFRTQIPNASLDSTSSVQSVSGLEFQDRKSVV